MPTLPVVIIELAYIVDAVVMLETLTMELTVSVENALTPAPVPGTALLILDTVSVERVNVNPLNVLPISVETVAVGAVMVLPVRVDIVIFTALNAGTAELRRAR
jgi:hypothetical protein